MRKIIKGFAYDTATAKEVGEWRNAFGYKDFNQCEETLYQTKAGAYFIYGTGGALSKYAYPVGNSGWAGGEKITPLTEEEARKWSEDHLDADKYENLFGKVPEASYKDKENKMEPDIHNFRVVCQSCGMTGLIDFSKPTEESSWVIGCCEPRWENFRWEYFEYYTCMNCAEKKEK